MRSVLFGTLASLALAACGPQADPPQNDPRRPDARLPDTAFDAAPVTPSDASPDALSDAFPSVPPPIDIDQDGHAADTDCNDADPEVWQALPFNFRDADGDAHTVPVAGMVCSGVILPPGYSLVGGELDCDDDDPSVFTTVAGFLDIDGDGVGDGIAVSFCTADDLPNGYAAIAGDCAPLDPERWVQRPYSFRDVDRDGAVAAEAGIVCSGGALPPDFLETAPIGQPLDCDDNNAAIWVSITMFVDADLDGVGAGAGQLACTNGTALPGFSTSASDCDDADGTAWLSLIFTAVDSDGDGFTTPALGARCTAGTLLPPYYAMPHGNDCNDSDDTHWESLKYVAMDEDGDGFTVPATGEICTDGTLFPPFHTAPIGNDCDDADPTLTHFAVLYPDADSDSVGTSPRQIVCLGIGTPAGLVSGGYDEDDLDPAVVETEDFDDLLGITL